MCKTNISFWFARLSHLTSICSHGWGLQLKRGHVTSYAASCLHVWAEGINHSLQQPGKCQSVMMEDSENSKWQDWRFFPPLRQLGWFPLWTVPVQLLESASLWSLRHDGMTGDSISVGASVPVWVIWDICECEPTNLELKIRLISVWMKASLMPPPPYVDYLYSAVFCWLPMIDGSQNPQTCLIIPTLTTNQA